MLDYEDKYYGENEEGPSAEDCADRERDSLIAEKLENETDITNV